MTSTDVPVEVEVDASTPRGRCAVPESTLEELSVEVGHQVRLWHGGTCALFTVSRGTDASVAVNPDGRSRIEASEERFEGTLDAVVPHPDYDESTARARSEFVERTVERSSKLAVCAPHGGYVEYGTDEQAERLSDWLGGTLWYCSGWNDGGGAYRRWHVSSADIHPGSFPGLDRIADVGFERAVSFHGWSESHVAVGGGAPRKLREAVRDSISDAVGGAFRVEVGADDARDGSSSENFVNWLTASGAAGIQLEQCYEARTTYRSEVLEGVADVLADH
ncbi:poly-gamma-glutamate hydrolase family protein [Halobium salinum]|uniref:Poly-gamma-glutamate hydrolase family protein n=1 Tax=Halobium salinum TaxID=1364940 RepID=A0ABD5PG70_9EURY|nr:poly-gamma-glutamate hydrolase family protein [Halobium salinum]